MKSLKDYITVSISILALLISGTTFYLTRLYDPGVTIHLSPRMEWVTNDTNHERIILPVTFLNTGSRSHVINQVVLEIKKDLAQELFQFVAGSYAVNRSAPREFAPEPLTAGSSLGRSYLFQRFEAGRNTIRPTGNSTIPPQEFALRSPGKYSGTLMLRKNGSDDYVIGKRFTFAVTPDEAQQLRVGPFRTQLLLDLETSDD